TGVGSLSSTIPPAPPIAPNSRCTESLRLSAGEVKRRAQDRVPILQIYSIRNSFGEFFPKTRRLSTALSGPWSLALRLLRRRAFRGGRLRLGLADHEQAQSHVEHRREEQTDKRDAEHAGEDGDAERLAHLGAGTSGDGERQHTQDEGEGRHQDRAQ